MCPIGRDEPKVRIHGRIRDGGMRGDGGRKSGGNSESEVEEGGGRGEQERRERFVFMLLETEVFIAPPTHRDRKRGMGERGCFVEKERWREKRKTELF